MRREAAMQPLSGSTAFIGSEAGGVYAAHLPCADAKGLTTSRA